MRWAEDLPTLPGIYKLTNLVNGKIYVGKSVNLKRRLNQHKNNECETFIKNAIKKYGLVNFRISILEVFPSRNHLIDKMLLDREEIWIRIYNSTDRNIGYNFCKRSTDRTGCKYSEETKKRISNSMKNMSDEKRKIWIEANRQKSIGVYPTDETRKLLSERCHFNRKIAIINPETNEITEEFTSISNAVRKIGKGDVSAIQKAAKSIIKTAYGFKWRLLDQDGKIIPPINP